jgi:two-component sensor histidine kinase
MPLGYLDRRMERKPSLVGSVVGVVLALAVPTLVVMALKPILTEKAWFGPYYPSVLVVALLMGWRHGLVVALLSALVLDYLFWPPLGSFVLHPAELAGIVVFLFTSGLVVMTAALLRASLVQLHAAAEKERTLSRELKHRVKNILAVVQGLAFQAMRSAVDPKAFYDDFLGRLQALAGAHDILSSSDWTTCELPELARAGLDAFNGSGAITVMGPRCSVPSASCVPLVLALHELATNAMKHGALSVPQGRVSLVWSLCPNGTGGDLLLEWVESGGPTVAPPTRRGLGSRLLVQQPGLDEVNLSYDPTGLRCTLLVRGVAATSSVAAPSKQPSAGTAISR